MKPAIIVCMCFLLLWYLQYRGIDSSKFGRKSYRLVKRDPNKNSDNLKTAHMAVI